MIFKYLKYQKYNQKNNIIKNINLFIILFFIFYFYHLPLLYAAGSNSGSPGSSGQGQQNIGQLLVNISKIYPQIFVFFLGLCVIIGIFLILMAMFKLKHLADFRTYSAGSQEIGKAIGLIVVGIAFLWMPFVLNAFTYTIFGMGISSLQQTYPIAKTGELAAYRLAFFQLMQVIGLISFIKGFFIFAGMSKGQQQQGTFGKAITHIIAGLFLFHLYPFMSVLEKTTGYTFI